MHLAGPENRQVILERPIGLEKLARDPLLIFFRQALEGLALVGRHQFVEDPRILAVRDVLRERTSHLGSAVHLHLVLVHALDVELAQILARRLTVAFFKRIEQHIRSDLRGRRNVADGDFHNARWKRRGLLLAPVCPNAATVRQFSPQLNPQLLDADRLVVEGMRVSAVSNLSFSTLTLVSFASNPLARLSQ